MSAWAIGFAYFTACGIATGLLARVAKEFRLIFVFYVVCWLGLLGWHNLDALMAWAASWHWSF